MKNKQIDGQMSIFEISEKPLKFHEAEWLRANGFKNIYNERPPGAGLYEFADIECPTKTKQLEVTENGSIKLDHLAMGKFRANWWRTIEEKT